MNRTIRLYSPGFCEARTYLMAAVFICANLLLPQLVHLIPQGGVTWLPIYFFTLVAACKFGWRVGIVTAMASPLLNWALFAMPAAAVLPAVLMKSVLLATIAATVTSRTGKVTLPLLTAIVLGYQLTGCAVEWLMKADFMAACQDFRIGIPGMLLQIFGGWAVIRRL